MSTLIDTEKRIAKITDAFLGWEDHGIFTCSVTLTYGNSSFQGAGNYALDRWVKRLDRRVGTAEGLDFIMRLLEAAGASSWDKLVGRTVYAIVRDGKVQGIVPLPTESGTSFMFADAFPDPSQESGV